MFHLKPHRFHPLAADLPVRKSSGEMLGTWNITTNTFSLRRGRCGPAEKVSVGLRSLPKKTSLMSTNPTIILHMDTFFEARSMPECGADYN
ncbi:uncharacterized protein LOC118897742 isoform X2 [Balaenoptera musculus]|uniref:Uncharacterized protein LOC118897742 isoform X2 n=1 Tax=Balaenoptera musculus TaxID=9771 RepID=A0A8B8XTK5_BALMU|nr:uncharacterized protein LOC118897742 isoform X2 [Balaenoptera musculus]